MSGATGWVAPHPAMLAQSMRLSKFYLLAAGLAALFLVYYHSFENSFHYDDFHSIVENPHIRDLSNIPAFFYRDELFSSMPERAMFRPLLLVSYALNYGWGEYEVWGYHLVNFAVHFLCVAGVFLLGRALGKTEWVAVLGAGFFALQPLQAEAVNYISSRSESLAALCYLVALLSYMRGRKEVQDRWVFLTLTALAFVAGLLYKSIVITLPATLLFGEWVWRRSGREKHVWKAVRPYHLLYWGIALGYLGYVWSVTPGLKTTVDSPVRSLDVQVFTQIKAAIYYLYLGGMPVHLSVEHAFAVSNSLLTAQVLLPLALLLSMLAFLLARGKGTTFLLCAWAALVLAPTAIVPLNVLVNEHRLYLPLAFISLAAAEYLVRLPTAAKKYLCAALLLFCGLLSHQRSAVWADELSLWGDAVIKAPQMYRTHLHFGGALEKTGRWQEAQQHYQEAATLAPAAVEVHYNLGNALRQLKHFEAALAAYQKSLELNPDYMPSLVNLGHMYLIEVGDSSRAIQYYQKAVQLGTRQSAVYEKLGSILHKRGEYDTALQIYTKGLTQIPSQVIFYLGLAMAHDRLGQRQRAVDHYRTFLRFSRGKIALEQYSRARLQTLEQGEP